MVERIVYQNNPAHRADYGQPETDYKPSSISRRSQHVKFLERATHFILIKQPSDKIALLNQIDAEAKRLLTETVSQGYRPGDYEYINEITMILKLLENPAGKRKAAFEESPAYQAYEEDHSAEITKETDEDLRNGAEEAMMTTHEDAIIRLLHFAYAQKDKDPVLYQKASEQHKKLFGSRDYIRSQLKRVPDAQNRIQAMNPYINFAEDEIYSQLAETDPIREKFHNRTLTAAEYDEQILRQKMPGFFSQEEANKQDETENRKDSRQSTKQTTSTSKQDQLIPEDKQELDRLTQDYDISVTTLIQVLKKFPNYNLTDLLSVLEARDILAFSSYNSSQSYGSSKELLLKREKEIKRKISIWRLFRIYDFFNDSSNQVEEEFEGFITTLANNFVNSYKIGKLLKLTEVFIKKGVLENSGEDLANLVLNQFETYSERLDKNFQQMEYSFEEDRDEESIHFLN